MEVDVQAWKDEGFLTLVIFLIDGSFMSEDGVKTAEVAYAKKGTQNEESLLDKA